jgi:hypothetical protein
VHVHAYSTYLSSSLESCLSPVPRRPPVCALGAIHDSTACLETAVVHAACHDDWLHALGVGAKGGCPYQMQDLWGGNRITPCRAAVRIPIILGASSAIVAFLSYHLGIPSSMASPDECRRVILCGSDLQDWHGCSVWCKLCGATSSCPSTFLYFHRPGAMCRFQPALCKARARTF